jgi:hypothetical protein
MTNTPFASFLDQIPLHGHLRVSKRTRVDDVILQETLVDETNLIVTTGRQYLLSALFRPGRVSDPIATLRVGNGGTLDVNGVFPLDPKPDRTSLYAYTLSADVFPTPNSDNTAVTFLADIPENVGNGGIISEAGLFTGSGTMFNIKTFGGIPKTSAFSVHFEWTVSIG